MRSRLQQCSDLAAAAAALAAAIVMASPVFVAAVAPQPPPAGASPAQPPPALQPDLYRLAQGDVIEVRLFYNPELNEQMQIRPDGHISLSLIGDADVAGKTIPEAAAMLEKLYASEVRTPKVVIQVRTFSGQKVYVTGEVIRPGVINLPRAMTVFEAISEAGGVKPTGNTKLAILIRKGPDGLPKGYRLALSKGGAPTAAASTILGSFDVVMIPESKTSRVDRWVDQNIRQLIPVTLSAGFSYVIARQTGGGTVVPIF
jgi:protein involved in polysaccharide export with SLBB domain